MEKTPWHLHVLAIGLFTLMVVGSGCFSRPAAKVNKAVPPVPPPVDTVCTMEAKQCPDGSYVGRVPPSCEFSPCPSSPAPAPAPAPGPVCKNTCGNGQCDEIVCMAVGCPCAETKASCPQDCAQLAP